MVRAASVVVTDSERAKREPDCNQGRQQHPKEGAAGSRVLLHVDSRVPGTSEIPHDDDDGFADGQRFTAPLIHTSLYCSDS